LAFFISFFTRADGAGKVTDVLASDGPQSYVYRMACDDEASDQIEDNAVCCPCPNCCEADPDKLVWLDDDETVRCDSCGHEYKP
jgi:hypothetical protein